MDILKSTLNAHYMAMDDTLTDILNTVKEIVKKAGGLLHTQKEKCDAIYAVEYLSVDYSELVMRQVCGIRLIDDDLQIYTENADSRNIKYVVSENDLKDPELEDQWSSLLCSENIMYVPTLVNIA